MVWTPTWSLRSISWWRIAAKKVVGFFNLNKQTGLSPLLVSFGGVHEENRVFRNLISGGAMEGGDVALSAPPLTRPLDLVRLSWSSDVEKRWSFVVDKVWSYSCRASTVVVCNMGGGGRGGPWGWWGGYQLVCALYCICIEDICRIWLHIYIYIIVHRD